jgi:hypothetical protein
MVDTARIMTVHYLKAENVRMLATALRDTLPVWAPIATSQERVDIIALLENARITNKNAGIDDDINAIVAAIKNVKE